MYSEYVNIDDIKEVPRLKLHSLVAEVIAEENLEIVNRNSNPVIPKNSFYTRHVKRLLDIIISLSALIITLPINLIIGLGTLFSLGFPLFFQEKRVGKNNTEFVITKFRNMTNEKDENGDLLPPSERVTKFGRFVRKTSLDELLNFWSVLRGDMSIIGPRPLQPVYLERYSERHKLRSTVKPGLECPPLYTKRAASWSEQFENDIFYVENVSFLLDMKMIFFLVRLVLDKKVRAQSANGVRGGFMGYSIDGTSIESIKTPKEYVDKAIAKEKSI